MPLFSDAPLNVTEPITAVVGNLLVRQAGMQRITWRDGSRADLHKVASAHPRDCTLLRAARGSDGLWRVFHLNRACPGIEVEFRRLHIIDWPGLVFYSLRCGYESAESFTRWLMADQPLKHAAADLGQSFDSRVTA